ncbi:hypothetical protein DFP72DRAFT_68695 [Ephemerocybe angulata]|uniref:Secreted protein n=1 Tax=Ephemerocybe angulata TaxID=980116 RepID=A0A8H6HE16_9AGAR|nr:hypothetical protein DFP72DRAFT_68695 [Tulosesus angulatus]
MLAFAFAFCLMPLPLPYAFACACAAVPPCPCLSPCLPPAFSSARPPPLALPKIRTRVTPVLAGTTARRATQTRMTPAAGGVSARVLLVGPTVTHATHRVRVPRRYGFVGFCTKRTTDSLCFYARHGSRSP